MTLIVSAITPQFAIQASDRRLTSMQTNKPEEDMAVKAVILDWHSTFAYTGFGELWRSPESVIARNAKSEKINTNLWMAEVLTQAVNIEDAYERLRVQAKEALSHFSLLPPSRRKHMFISTGWVNMPDKGLVSAIGIVHNDKDSVNFVTEIFTLGPLNIMVNTSFQLSSAAQKNLKRKINKCELDGLKPEDVGIALVETIREVSKKDATVGSDVLLTCIPRKQVETVIAGNGSWKFTADSLNDDEVTFRYIPKDMSPDQGILSSPTFVIGGNIFGQLNIAKGVTIDAKSDNS